MSLIRTITILAIALSISNQAVSSSPIVREDKFFQDVTLGEYKGFVKSQRIEMSPGFSAPTHSHPVPTFGVINKGIILYQEKGGKEKILKEGDTFFEPEGINIIKFNNISSETSAFTVFYIVEKDNSPTIHIN